MRAIVPARVDDSQTLTWVQTGSVAGLESPIPSAALRATRLQIVGSGQGSVATRDIVAELADLAFEVHRGGLFVDATRSPWPASNAPGSCPRPDRASSSSRSDVPLVPGALLPADGRRVGGADGREAGLEQHAPRRDVRVGRGGSDGAYAVP